MTELGVKPPISRASFFHSFAKRYSVFESSRPPLWEDAKKTRAAASLIKKELPMYAWLKGLPEDTRAYLLQNDFSYRIYLRLSRFSDDDRRACVSALKRLRLSFSHRSQAIEWIYEISQRDQRPVAQWLEHMPSAGFMKALYAARYPRAARKAGSAS